MSIFNESEPYPTELIKNLRQQIETLHSRIIEYDRYQFSFEKWKALNIKVIHLEEGVKAQSIVLERILQKMKNSVTEKQT